MYYLAPRPGKKHFSIVGFLNHTFSRGTIHSSSSNPDDFPIMDPHYFEHDMDLQMLIKQVRYIREVFKTAPFKDIVSEDIAAELCPGHEIQTDEELANWVKQTCSTGWHTTGSLSMRPKDKNGVVDPQLKVYGTKNIRVVDLSIVPMQVSAHTQSVAYTIAEQAADIIKGVFIP
jgi:choline dehydrogenase-like flavoprotein